MKLHERLAWIRQLKANSTIKAVLWVLADHADSEGHCWLLQSTLSRESGCAPRTVRKALKLLRTQGLLAVKHTGSYDHFYLNTGLMLEDLRVARGASQVGTTCLQNRPVNRPFRIKCRKCNTRYAEHPYGPLCIECADAEGVTYLHTARRTTP